LVDSPIHGEEETNFGTIPFKYPSKSDWSYLLQNNKVKIYKKGDLLIKQGEDKQKGSIIIIISGVVQIYHQHDNNIVNFIKSASGDALGEISFILGGTHTANAKVISNDLKCLKLRRHDLEIALKKNLDISFKFYYWLCVILEKRLRSFQLKK
jgi:CRP-like cAMP-binding protein